MVISSISSSYRTYNISYVTRGPLLVQLLGTRHCRPSPWPRADQGDQAVCPSGSRISKAIRFRV